MRFFVCGGGGWGPMRITSNWIKMPLIRLVFSSIKNCIFVVWMLAYEVAGDLEWVPSHERFHMCWSHVLILCINGEGVQYEIPEIAKCCGHNPALGYWKIQESVLGWWDALIAWRIVDFLGESLWRARWRVPSHTWSCITWSLDLTLFLWHGRFSHWHQHVLTLSMCSRPKGNTLEVTYEINDHQDNKGYYLDNENILSMVYIWEDNL
jgi:hypothetical protein